MEKPPYTSKFEIKASVILPEQSGKMQEIKASITSLREIFPADVNPQEDKDLLYIAGNLAVANLVNRNGDCITGATTIEVYKKFEKRFIDLDHDRSKIHGYIMVAGLSDFETSKLITEEEAAKIDGPFNIAIGGVIWKAVNDKLAEYLVKADDNPDLDTLSFSFEVGFWDYKIAVGPADVTKAKVYSKEENPVEFERYSKYLVANKGKGQDKDGNLVYRVIDTKVMPLGAGIVVNPAAHVEGITTLIEIEADEEINADTEISEDIMAKLKDLVIQILNEHQTANLNKVEENVAAPIITETEIQDTGFTLAKIADIPEDKGKEITDAVVEGFKKPEETTASTQNLTEELKNNSQIKNNSVNQHIPNMPKITKTEDIVSSWNDIVKHEAAASDITKFIADEIARVSTEYTTQLTEKEAAAKKLKEDTDAALAQVATLRQELDAIKAEKNAQEAQAKFDSRMSAFDNEFDLTDEDRQVIASDIKALDDTAFEAYTTKFKVLAKEKSKAYKQAKASAVTQELEKKGFKATIDKDLNFAEIVANVVENRGQAPVLTGAEPASSETLQEKFAKAFSAEGAITVNGKPFKKKTQE